MQVQKALMDIGHELAHLASNILHDVGLRRRLLLSAPAEEDVSPMLDGSSYPSLIPEEAAEQQPFCSRSDILSDTHMTLSDTHLTPSDII